ncbi:MAG: serine O-acetyltransferase [Rhodobacteraceae bacterium]|nr:serine O-acetyltransferase [Paracoccaceae bacterium]
MVIASENVKSCDPVWDKLCLEAGSIIENEPIMSGLVHSSILHHETFEKALAFRFSIKLASPELSEQILREIADDAYDDDPSIGQSARADLIAVFDRDPACNSFYQPLLFFKGFQALQSFRVAQWLWSKNRKDLAYFVQKRTSEEYGVDIHPGAFIGHGVLIDHAHSIVIGETSTVGNDVSMLHSVTLGGTGKEVGDRHPKVANGVLLGAGAIVLGNIKIGKCARVAAGSVVLNDVPDCKTVAGIPAKVIGDAGCAEPSRTMVQFFHPSC